MLVLPKSGNLSEVMELEDTHEFEELQKRCDLKIKYAKSPILVDMIIESYNHQLEDADQETIDIVLRKVEKHLDIGSIPESELVSLYDKSRKELYDFYTALKENNGGTSFV